MTKGDELMSVIESHRVISNDGSLVTYDLTTGVDFANPKITAGPLLLFSSGKKLRTGLS